MTTNDMSIIPKELYRPGRIDSVLEFEGLDQKHATTFAKAVAKQFDVPVDASTITRTIKGLFDEDSEIVSQAQVVQTVYRLLKTKLIKEKAKNDA